MEGEDGGSFDEAVEKVVVDRGELTMYVRREHLARVALIAGVSFLATRRPNMPPTLSERLRAVGDAWMHPHHVARSRARASSPGEMDFTRKAVLTVLSLVAAEGAKIGFAKLAGKLDEKKPA